MEEILVWLVWWIRILPYLVIMIGFLPMCICKNHILAKTQIVRGIHMGHKKKFSPRFYSDGNCSITMYIFPWLPKKFVTASMNRCSEFLMSLLTYHLRIQTGGNGPFIFFPSFFLLLFLKLYFLFKLLFILV